MRKLRVLLAMFLLALTAACNALPGTSSSPPPNSPAFCGNLHDVPTQLKESFVRAAIGGLTGEDVSVMDETIKALRDAALGNDVPANLKASFTATADEFTKVRDSGQVTPIDVARLSTSLDNLQKEVDAACPK